MVIEKVDIREMAKKVRKEYDYMDKMPFEGWMWEFIRRNRQYRDACATLAKKHWDMSTQKQSDDRRRKVGKAWALIRSLGIDGEIWRPIDERNHFIIYRKRGNEIREFNGVPRPECGWREFSQKFPALRIAAPIVFTYETIEEWLVNQAAEDEMLNVEDLTPENYHEEYFKKIREAGRYMDTDDIYFDKQLTEAARSILFELSDGGHLKDRVLISIPARGNRQKIKKILNKCVDDLIAPTGKRMRKEWKYYLVTYDLRELENLSYSIIANILESAYPYRGKKKRSFYYDTDMVEDYFEKAHSLIDLRKYQEFLCS